MKLSTVPVVISKFLAQISDNVVQLILSSTADESIINPCYHDGNFVILFMNADARIRCTQLGHIVQETRETFHSMLGMLALNHANFSSNDKLLLLGLFQRIMQVIPCTALLLNRHLGTLS